MSEIVNEASSNPKKQFKQSLSGQVDSVEQEARMVLPGIQAIFGFQLIAVFNEGFRINLTDLEKELHLAALLLIAIAAICVMAPAAYHRQANHQISKHFVQLSSRFLAWAMVPLALGSCLDIYIVSRVIVKSFWTAGLVTGVIFFFYLWAWFILPRLHAKKIEEMPVSKLPE